MFLTVVGIAAATYALYLIRTVLGLLAISIFLAVALGPAVDVFVGRGLQRGLAILVVYRRTVNVHPLLVIVAILIGSALLGVLGALVAIPVAAGVQIVVRDAWTRRNGDTALPEPEPAAG